MTGERSRSFDYGGKAASAQDDSGKKSRSLGQEPAKNCSFHLNQRATSKPRAPDNTI
jgi:hypothetical protein